jgi:hypothetical protein
VLKYFETRLQASTIPSRSLLSCRDNRLQMASFGPWSVHKDTNSMLTSKIKLAHLVAISCSVNLAHGDVETTRVLFKMIPGDFIRHVGRMLCNISTELLRASQ